MNDLLIKNGKLINDDIVDILINNRKIQKIGKSIDEDAREILDLNSKHYLSYGWIDDHVHCYEEINLYYDYPDEVGIKTGVTSIIDAGTTGSENILEFYNIAKKAKTNVFAMINISKWGIVEQDELADLHKVKSKLIKKSLKELPNFIVGIKARMSNSVIGDNGIRPLELAKEIQLENNNIPLMVHVGSNPPELKDIFSRLTKGDIVTHCFNGKPNGILDKENGKIKKIAWEAFNRGIIFDIGHGTESFSFTVAETAFKEGIKANSISTDIYYRNRIEGPVYDFVTTLEKMRVVGYSWEEIIKKSTSVPAENFKLKNKGYLKKGYDADITIFDIKKGQKILIDSHEEERIGEELINPLITIIGGKRYDNYL